MRFEELLFGIKDNVARITLNPYDSKNGFYRTAVRSDDGTTARVNPPGGCGNNFGMRDDLKIFDGFSDDLLIEQDKTL